MTMGRGCRLNRYSLPSFKRMLGEYVNSVLRAGILNEALTKVYTYNAVEAHRNGPT